NQTIYKYHGSTYNDALIMNSMVQDSYGVISSDIVSVVSKFKGQNYIFELIKPSPSLPNKAVYRIRDKNYITPIPVKPPAAAGPPPKILEEDQSLSDMVKSILSEVKDMRADLNKIKPPSDRMVDILGSLTGDKIMDMGNAFFNQIDPILFQMDNLSEVKLDDPPKISEVQSD